jgi:hypothetical protein
MRIILLLTAAAGLGACERAKSVPTDLEANLSTENTAQAAAPTPHYQTKDGDIYVYTGVGGTAEQPTTVILSYRYLGRAGDVYRLQNVTNDGTPAAITECTYPCRVAKISSALGVQRMVITDESIPGEAFADAAAGLLAPAKGLHDESAY